MIYAQADATVDEDVKAHLLGSWSTMIIGNKPDGLLDCFLLEGPDHWRVVSLWDSADALERAHEDENTHPALTVFGAAGVEADHTSYEVAGHWHSGS